MHSFLSIYPAQPTNILTRPSATNCYIQTELITLFIWAIYYPFELNKKTPLSETWLLNFERLLPHKPSTFQL